MEFIRNILQLCILTNALGRGVRAGLCGTSIDHLLIQGHSLAGVSFWETKTKDAITCAQTCIRRAECRSFNFNIGTNVCQLNSNTGPLTRTGKDDRHSDIASWPSQIDPNCYSRPCGENSVCIPGTLGDGGACSYTCFSLERQCPFPPGGTPNQPRGVGSIFTHICDPRFVGGDSAICLSTGEWNKTIDTACRHCEEGWVRFQTKCYLFPPEETTYKNVLIICFGEDSELLYLESKDEMAFVKSEIRKDPAQEGYWINLRQISSTDEAVIWHTGNGTLTPTFTDWRSGEPNKLQEQCTVIRTNTPDYNWVDVDCDIKLSFRPICKKSLIIA